MPNVSEEINREAQQEARKVLVFTGRGLVTGARLARALAHALKVKNEHRPGQKSIRKLSGKGEGLSSVEITDKNIKSFEPVAKKYGIRYALQKDSGSNPSKYLVFFRSNSADAMTAAFREYAEKTLNKWEKESILAKMAAKKKELIAAMGPERDTVRNKTQGEIEL